MDPQLVHPAGRRVQFDQGSVIGRRQGAVAAEGGLGTRRIRGDGAHIALAADLLPQQGCVDGPGPRLRCRRKQRQIGLPEPPRLHRLAEEAGRGFGLRRQDHPRGVAVQPMHQIRPLSVRAGEGPQQIIQRMRLDAAALAGQAGGLVEGDHRLILMDHPRADSGDVIFAQGNGGTVGHRVCIGERPTVRQPLSAGHPSCSSSRHSG